MKGRGVQGLIHVIGCTVFLSLPILFSPDFGSQFSVFKAAPFQRDFFAYVLLLMFFYLNYYLLIPKFYLNKEYVKFAFLVVLSYGIIAVLPFKCITGSDSCMHMSGPPLHENLAMFRNMPLPFHYSFHQYFFQFLIVLIFSLMLKINSRLKLAEKQKVTAELSYLKAQINPHFLFNTLNSIYSLAIEKSDYTATAVVKLSGMMRYVITEASNKYVPLEKEINYLSDYIELQKIRLDNTIKLDYSVVGETTDKVIAPLVLISFIENAFKYGVNAEENSDIKIHINITKTYLHLRVLNNKVHVHQNAATKSGLGIENTRHRLQLLYPGNHKLTIKDTKDEFSVLLSLYLA
jgi:hypothetical protein